MGVGDAPARRVRGTGRPAMADGVACVHEGSRLAVAILVMARHLLRLRLPAGLVCFPPSISVICPSPCCGDNGIDASFAPHPTNFVSIGARSHSPAPCLWCLLCSHSSTFHHMLPCRRHAGGLPRVRLRTFECRRGRLSDWHQRLGCAAHHSPAEHNRANISHMCPDHRSRCCSFAPALHRS